jgi:hypothetical protein
MDAHNSGVEPVLLDFLGALLHGIGVAFAAVSLQSACPAILFISFCQLQVAASTPGTWSAV